MRRAPLACVVLVVGCAATTGDRTTTQTAPASAAPSSFASSTSATPPVVRAALPPRGVVTCALEGRFPIRAGEKILLGESSDVEARFTGHPVELRIESIDTAKGPVATAVVRAPSSPPALSLRAKLRVDAVPFRAARDIRVAGDLVVIPRGAALVMSSGEGSAVGVKPRYGDFDGASAAASCEDVELGPPTAHADASRRTSPSRLAKKRVALFAAPNGVIALELDARREGPTLDVVESRGDFRRVRYDDGVRIDAWVRATDLASGEGSDCDDCHGAVMDVEDVCPKAGCPDAKGGPFHARRKVAVRDRPSPDGQPLGWLEEDGEVRIVGHKGTYARVEALKGEIAAPAGGFWIDEATLDPRGK